MHRPIQSIILVFSFCSFAFAHPIIHLTAPKLSDENIIGYNVGLRPHRASGIRLETERLSDKLIVHNYGHGGAGITLSYGSAQEAIRLMQANFNPALGSMIAVIGSGVIGLSVANQLLDLGYPVRIYSREFPPYTTSEVAAGLWDAFGVDVGDTAEAKAQFERIKQSSYDYFYELATTNREGLEGISLVDAYYFYKDRQPRVDPRLSIIDVELSNGKRMPAEKDRLMMIETPAYMQYLLNRAAQRGAKFITHTFNSLSDVLELEEVVVFNCLGLGAKTVFNDPLLQPVRGQLIYFKRQEGIDYIAASKGKPNTNTFVCLFPYRDKFILGGSYEKGVDQLAVVNSTCADILEQTRLLFNPDSQEPDEL